MERAASPPHRTVGPGLSEEQQLQAGGGQSSEDTQDVVGLGGQGGRGGLPPPHHGGPLSHPPEGSLSEEREL